MGRKPMLAAGFVLSASGKATMWVLKNFIKVVIWPFEAILNKLTKSSSYIINLKCNFFYFGIFIEPQMRQGEDFEASLQKSYILYLAKYFYICDERQVEPVKQVFLDYIRRKDSHKIITEKIFAEVWKTFNNKEQDAFIHLFPLGIPPLTYIKDKKEIQNKNPLASYELRVSGQKRLGTNFQMSLGPDIILLPMLLGILFEYIMDNIHDTEKEEKLKQAVIRMIIEFEEQNPRDLKTFINLPNEIIESMPHIEVVCEI